jgi:hypothetical protein
MSQNPQEISSAPKLPRQLAALGYPGFSYMQPEAATPAQLLLLALTQADLETRVTEALPWVLCRYPDLEWPWLVENVQRHGVQNRLGFLVGVALEVAQQCRSPSEIVLAAVQASLEELRVEREDTLCRKSMCAVERRYLKVHRSTLAKRWHLLTGMTGRTVPYWSAG